MRALLDVNVWVALFDDALAKKHKGCLATFDRAIALSAAVRAQPRHLKLL